MPWIQKAVCDGPGCKVERKEGNHWFEATFVGRTDPNRIEVVIYHMAEHGSLDADRKCFCGAPCLLRKIESFLDGSGSVAIADATGVP
jgi:hypothetical protein